MRHATMWLLAFWILVVLYMSTTLYRSNCNGNTERSEHHLGKALQALDSLRIHYDQLLKLDIELKDLYSLINYRHSADNHTCKVNLEEVQRKLQNVLEERANAYNSSNSCSSNNSSSSNNIPEAEQLSAKAPHFRLLPEPSTEHEYLRRKINNGVVEIGYTQRSTLAELKNMVKDNSEVVSKIDSVLEDWADQQRVLLTDLYNISQSGDAGNWREKEAAELSDLVQRRLHFLQNPKDCSTANKLVCNLQKNCGYGCQIHHVVYCFIIAYGMERTLILNATNWMYSSAGWEMFKPVSETCTDQNGSSSHPWGPLEKIAKTQVIHLPIVEFLHPRPPFMPPAIPEDLAPRLIRIHGAPIVWWVGQFLKYLLRPKPDIERDIHNMKEKLGIESPIVGVHVRRTDKIVTEAAFHEIDEYMKHVEEWYLLLKQKQHVKNKRVYLATDDQELLSEAREKFPEYMFISDKEISRMAGLKTRYSDASLWGVIIDVHFLSVSNYLVCTFSSNICRLAYEIMQTYHPDAATWFHSLDDIYYFNGQNPHEQMAIYKHHARKPGEIEILPGDYIGIAGNHWNGYSKGTNRRTGKVGLYPSYKVIDKIHTVKFPTYPMVELESGG